MATVLVIDDEPDIRELVQLRLEADGHEVWSAGDGAEGIELCLRLRPHCIVLDVMMPVMDGHEVLRHLRRSADEHLRALPVLLLTAAAGATRESSLDEGADAYLAKPFSPREVAAVVAGLVERRAGAH